MHGKYERKSEDFINMRCTDPKCGSQGNIRRAWKIKASSLGRWLNDLASVSEDEDGWPDDNDEDEGEAAVPCPICQGTRETMFSLSRLS